MGNDPSPSLLPFTSPLAPSILPCEISQIGQTVVAPPNRRSQSVAAVQGDAKIFTQSQSQIHPMCLRFYAYDADNCIPLDILTWNSCLNPAATPCMENHFPDGIMAGCGRRRKARDIEQRSVDVETRESGEGERER